MALLARPAAQGKIGILFGNWYSEPLRNRVFKQTKKAELDQRLDEINRFEAMLVREGVLLIKFWFHLTRAAQKQRLKSLEKNAETRWRVTERDWLFFKNYDRFHNVAERMLRHTSTGEAPWIIVDGSDPRYRSLLVGRTLLEADTATTQRGRA